MNSRSILSSFWQYSVELPIHEDICRKLSLLPVDQIAHVLTIAVADDLDDKTLNK